jgi:hypothetical protein
LQSLFAFLGGGGGLFWREWRRCLSRLSFTGWLRIGSRLFLRVNDSGNCQSNYDSKN